MLTDKENRKLAALPPFNWREGQRCDNDILEYHDGWRCRKCGTDVGIHFAWRQGSGRRYGEQVPTATRPHDIPMPDFEGDPAKVCAVFDALKVATQARVLTKLGDIWYANDYPLAIAIAKAIAAVVGEK